MTRVALPLAFQVEGKTVRGETGETLAAEVGASVFVLTSCSASLGIELRTTYVGGEQREDVIVAESAVAGAGPAELRSRSLPVGAGALTGRRRILLYDHLHSLQDLAMQAGARLAVAGLDAAVDVLDPHSRIDPSS